jgi:cytochrome P450
MTTTAPTGPTAAAAAVDIYSPETYLDAPPHELFAELRRTQPVYWQDMPGQPGYWAVLKHKDVETVARTPLLFSAEEGGVVLEDLEGEQLENMRGMLLAMDPPRHSDYRRPMVKRFVPKVMEELEDRIRVITKEIFAGVRQQAAAEEGVEFVRDVTSSLPTRIIGELVGLPEDDWERVHHMAEMNTHGQDPDYAPDGDGMNPGSGSMDMTIYGMQHAAGWRTRESAGAIADDLTTYILQTEFGGKLMTDLDFGVFFVQLVTAGQDTTQTMLASGLLALLQHPDQLAELRADRSLIPGAVEEILRYANPLHYFRRTATADTELGGAQIKAGDKVAMYYTSANRDEDVFVDPQTFNIHRRPNPHLSFGIAEHFCLGVHLARLEGRVFFEELLDTFPKIELTGAPVRTRSNLNNALKKLPVRLTV